MYPNVIYSYYDHICSYDQSNDCDGKPQNSRDSYRGRIQAMTTKSKLKPIPVNLTEFRKKQGLNQSDFWSRYGVTQSGGSRFESGRNLPDSLKILVRLHLSGAISDDKLKAARAK